MVTPLYPAATAAPWQYNSGAGATYYAGTNRPIAVVVHVMEGWASTGVQWAAEGHYGASWHFTVRRDGAIWQHLSFADGGYHAGIAASKPRPAWKLWRGHGTNINNYTVGIEHEGFSGQPFAAEQVEASARLCRWALAQMGQPADRDHVIGHYEVDMVDRPFDPGPTWPWERYMALVRAEDEEEDMAKVEELEARLAAAEGHIYQLRTQAWGEDPQKRDNAHPYGRFGDGAQATNEELAARIDRLAGLEAEVAALRASQDEHIANHAAGLYRAEPGEFVIEGKVRLS